MSLKIFALIVAAGKGARFSADKPKQYTWLQGMPVLRRAVLPFLNNSRIHGVKVVINPADIKAYDEAMKDLRLLAPSMGGSERQASVYNGLKDLASEGPAFVLIHDGARPLIRQKLLDSILDALSASDAVVPGLPLVDTIKHVDSAGYIEKTIPRDHLVSVQTPQAFGFEKLLQAHKELDNKDFSDDAALLEFLGYPVKVIPGEARNIKITTHTDLALAEHYLGVSQDRHRTRNMDVRTGLGFDVHRVTGGDHIWIGGISIPASFSLSGHSDADVALHALCDAILGGLGKGDIGLHFPPSDPQWKGKDSSFFVTHAKALADNMGAVISHIDLTVICEAPKISPYREAIRKKISMLLAIKPSQVSVKATTSEGLGFTGRKEGIAAQCIATLKVPSDLF